MAKLATPNGRVVVSMLHTAAAAGRLEAELTAGARRDPALLSLVEHTQRFTHGITTADGIWFAAWGAEARMPIRLPSTVVARLEQDGPKSDGELGRQMVALEVRALGEYALSGLDPNFAPPTPLVEFFGEPLGILEAINADEINPLIVIDADGRVRAKQNLLQYGSVREVPDVAYRTVVWNAALSGFFTELTKSLDTLMVPTENAGRRADIGEAFGLQPPAAST